MSLTDAQNEASEADDWSILETPEPLDLDPVAVNKKLRALGHCQRRLDEYDAAAESELADLDAAHAAERAELVDQIMRGRTPLAASRDHLATILELTGKARIAADPGEGTWTLPGGRLEVAGGGVEKEWTDDAALLAWAQKHAPEAVNDPKPPTVDKSKLWAVVKDAAVKTEHNRQAPANEDGTVVIDGKVVPGLIVKAKDRTVTPKPITDGPDA